jgi:hypothetical protein
MVKKSKKLNVVKDVKKAAANDKPEAAAEIVVNRSDS